MILSIYLPCSLALSRYFIQWLRDYRLHYEAGTWNDSQLWFSFLRAKASFFDANGSLELNLPHTIVRHISSITFRDSAKRADFSLLTPPPSATAEGGNNGTLQDASSVSPAPFPAVFEAAENHILSLLSASLSKFAGDATSNAGVLRRFYCGSAGVAAIGAGLIPVLLGIFRGYSRYTRLIAFPFFWLGGIIMLCAYASEFPYGESLASF